MLTFAGLTFVAASAALVDVRRNRRKHPWFGLVLLGYSALPPLFWIAFFWGVGDSGEWEDLEPLADWVYSIANTATFFALAGCACSASVGVSSLGGSASARRCALGLWGVALPSLFVCAAAGIPALLVHERPIVVDAGYEIALPAAILCTAVLLIRLGLPEDQSD